MTAYRAYSKELCYRTSLQIIIATAYRQYSKEGCYRATLQILWLCTEYILKNDVIELRYKYCDCVQSILWRMILLSYATNIVTTYRVYSKEGCYRDMLHILWPRTEHTLKNNVIEIHYKEILWLRTENTLRKDAIELRHKYCDCVHSIL